MFGEGGEICDPVHNLVKTKKKLLFFESSSSDPKKIALCLVLLQTAQSVELMKATDESLKPSS